MCITILDGRKHIQAVGCCDDGSDTSLVSPQLGEEAAQKGIGKLSSISTTTLSVALKSDKTPQTFTFSKAWTTPRTILHLTSGQMALIDVRFLVADYDLTCEDLLIGYPVFKHLQVDTRTLLEQKRAALEGADCTNVEHPTIPPGMGTVGRMMISQLHGNSTKYASRETRPRINYYQARGEDDPFPEASLLDMLDSYQHEDVCEAVKEMVESAVKNGLPNFAQDTIRDTVRGHIDIFRISFSSGPPASFKPLRIALIAHAKPVRVRLRNLS